MKMRYRIALLIVAELAMPLFCINFTNAGLATEEYAEMVHGSLATLIWLWALGFLRFPNWLNIPAQGTSAREG